MSLSLHFKLRHLSCNILIFPLGALISPQTLSQIDDVTTTSPGSSSCPYLNSRRHLLDVRAKNLMPGKDLQQKTAVISLYWAGQSPDYHLSFGPVRAPTIISLLGQIEPRLLPHFWAGQSPFLSSSQRLSSALPTVYLLCPKKTLPVPFHIGDQYISQEATG